MTEVWAGLVGSRSIGECSCDAKAKHWPPTPEEVAHREECLKVEHWLLCLKIVTRLVTEHGENLHVVSGGAPGADTMLVDAAKMMGVPEKRIKVIRPADGRQPFAVRAKARNTKIADKSTVLIALFGPGRRSPGTSDTVSKALARGIPVHVWQDGRWSTE